MKKQFSKAFLLPILFSCLTGCALSSNNLYDYNAYDKGSFKLNYYTHYDSVLKSNKVLEEKVYSINVTKGLNDLELKNSAKYQNIDDFYKLNSDKSDDSNKLVWSRYGNISEAAPDGKEDFFGATHSISFGRNGDASFARGVLSKLYDGRVSCSGKYAQSRVQIGEEGFGTVLPKQINSARYMSIALRGATDFDEITHKQAKLGANNVIDLKLTLYKRDLVNNTYQPYSFVMKDLYVVTDNQNDLDGILPADKTIGLSDTHCFTFFFDEGIDEDNNKFDMSNLDGVGAYSISYTLHPTQKEYEGHTYDFVTKGDQDGIHYGLLLYEVMMPGVTWR